MPERRKSTAIALDLRLSCTNPSICSIKLYMSVYYQLKQQQRWATRLARLVYGTKMENRLDVSTP